ncbi:MAG: type I restriction enzyme subunit R domain-containing protein, partial [Ktedonobacteraceae bacterium]
DEQRFGAFSRESGETIEIERQQNAALAERFKKDSDPLRLAFVCDMWSTGFDVPCLSTVYLNKRLRKHTLMQTIARANRVYG